jgi:hypothetical protein
MIRYCGEAGLAVFQKGEDAMKDSSVTVPVERIQELIHVVRGQKVMLDAD